MLHAMKPRVAFLVACLLAPCAGAAEAGEPGTEIPRGGAAPGTTGNPTLDRIVDMLILREHEIVRRVLERRPLVETYIQALEQDPVLGTVPKKDQYFVGKLGGNVGESPHSLVPPPGMGKRMFRSLSRMFTGAFVPSGFAEMFFVDPTGFDRSRYTFEFVRREFLGEVRTLVLEVKPRPSSGVGRFLGRVWVEDEGFHIVRFNGTFSPSTFTNKYLHFDSWRVQMGPGLWLPAYAYSEESDLKTSLMKRIRYKAQTRVWGYDLIRPPSTDEFTKVMVESAAARDTSEPGSDLSPVGSLRAWERLAEENVLERMTKAGLLAPEGDIEGVLATVVNNLEVTNALDIEPEVRCRVLLTTPLESFTIGHTIVLSRGLIDVLPDEASLAMVLAHELAHIALGHRLDTKYAFSDRLLFEDEETFARLGFRHDEKEEAEANERAIEILRNSPYQENLSAAGLFLEALHDRSATLPALIRPHLGDRLARQRRIVHMETLMDGAPPLEPARTDQVAALPLGGRIKVDPWSAKIELLRNPPVALLSAREKMPFEVTPFYPYLTRVKVDDRAFVETGVAASQTAAPPPSADAAVQYPAPD